MITACPSCQRNVQVPDDLLGKVVQCPLCQFQFSVGAGAPQVPPQPSSSPVEHAVRKATTVPDRPTQAPHFDDEESSEPPTYRGPAGKLRGTTNAVVVIVLLMLCMLGDVAGVGTGLVRFQLASQAIEHANAEIQESLETSDTATALVGVGQCGVYLFTVVAFCLWIYRAYDNLRTLRVPNLEYSPGWAVGYFFIPILNLYRPYQITQEIWKGSHPNPAGYWKRGRGSALIGVWWALWLLGNFVSNIVMRASFKDEPSLTEIQGIAVGNVIADILTFFAALLLIFIIWSIKKRQEQKYQLVVRGVADEPVEID